MAQAADLGGNRANRRPLGGVVAPVFPHHADSQRSRTSGENLFVVFCLSSLHLLKGWSFRTTRGGLVQGAGRFLTFGWGVCNYLIAGFVALP